MSLVNYRPEDFPPTDLDWLRLVPLIGFANVTIGGYEGVLRGIPNVDVPLSPLTL